MSIQVSIPKRHTVYIFGKILKFGRTMTLQSFFCFAVFTKYNAFRWPHPLNSVHSLFFEIILFYLYFRAKPSKIVASNKAKQLANAPLFADSDSDDSDELVFSKFDFILIRSWSHKLLIERRGLEFSSGRFFFPSYASSSDFKINLIFWLNKVLVKMLQFFGSEGIPFPPSPKKKYAIWLPLLDRMFSTKRSFENKKSRK